MHPTVLPLLFLLMWFPCRGFAAELFQGYPPDVRSRALGLIEAARPGNEEALAREARALRLVMLDYSIVSMNEVADRIFERAREEGWEKNAVDVLRPVTRIAPLSASLWAWLVKEDLSAFRIMRLFKNIDGFGKTLGWYGFALTGCLSWVFLCLAAAASWFAVWVSVSLLLRVQPAVTADFARIFRKLPYPELFAFAIFMVCLLAPVLSGVGLGVIVIFWLAFSAGYLRRWEVMTAVLSILLLAAVYVCGGAFHLAMKHAGEARKGGWFGGEGYLPLEWPLMETGKKIPSQHGSGWEEMVFFARARAEMQAGGNGLAELLWTDWILNASDPSPGYNNRGIVRHRMGMIPEALKDFEKAMEIGPSFGPAYWNSYQVYIGIFRLGDAAKVQEAAWRSLRNMSLFDYRAEEMTHGELLPSPLLVNDIWKKLFVPKLEWISSEDEDFVSLFLFRPLPKILVLPFVAIGCLWILLRRPLLSNAWKHNACRSCGVCLLAGGDIDAAGICGRCRTQVGVAINEGEDRETWLHTIAMHGRYVKACSVVVPGAGAFWAGKTVSLLIYGILLSLLLGGMTVSVGTENTPSLMISGIMKGITPVMSAVLFLVWVSGIAWSWRAFDSLRFKYNIVPRR